VDPGGQRWLYYMPNPTDRASTELDWFYGGGAGQFWPEAWEAFSGAIPKEERGDLIGAYHRRLFGDIEADTVKFSRTWTSWENTLATLESTGRPSKTPAYYARAFARIENHYFINKGFLETDQYIMENMYKIKDIPGYIVQGRYDMICPPHTAHKLPKNTRVFMCTTCTQCVHNLYIRFALTIKNSPPIWNLD